MANIDRPNGATWIRSITGGGMVVNEYAVDASNGAAIFPGDFVTRENDGNCAVTNGSDILLGVCVGVKSVTAESTPYLAVSTAGTIYVCDDPHAVYEIQEDDGGTALVAADQGANCDVLVTAGATSPGRSRQELDRSDIATGAAQLRLVRLVPRDDNAYGDWADWEVMISEHSYNTTAGV